MRNNVQIVVVVASSSSINNTGRSGVDKYMDDSSFIEKDDNLFAARDGDDKRFLKILLLEMKNALFLVVMTEKELPYIHKQRWELQNSSWHFCNTILRHFCDII